jgi:hypothetical protein
MVKSSVLCGLDQTQVFCVQEICSTLSMMSSNPTNITCFAAATSSSISSPASQPPPSLPDTGVQKEEPDSPDSDMNPHQPPPAMPVQQFQLFGDDPSEFPDPTIYHIKDITPDMSEDEKKQIYCVAGYPDSDLHDLTPGTPPDQDFSNAKPSNQVNASTFANYVEPFIRPLTEEDRGFLTERVSSKTLAVVPAFRGLLNSNRCVYHCLIFWSCLAVAAPKQHRMPPSMQCRTFMGLPLEFSYIKSIVESIYHE